MSAQPDWQGPLGRALRRAEIPDCGCKPKILHDPDCPYQGRDERSPCDCRYGFKGGACSHIRAHDPDLTFEELARLVLAFDPGGHDEPPVPPCAAVAEDAEALLHLRIVRRARGMGLRHPADVLPGQLDTLGIQARAGLKQDGTRTPRLTFLEKRLLEDLEAQVLPAYLMWPWSRAGEDWLPQAAQALREIERRQLWRETALSFPAYCLSAYGWQQQDLDMIFSATETLPLRKVS